MTASVHAARRACDWLRSLWNAGLLGSDPEARECVKDLCSFVEESMASEMGDSPQQTPIGLGVATSGMPIPKQITVERLQKLEAFEAGNRELRAMVETLESRNRRLRAMVDALADRCADQSELLTRRAGKVQAIPAELAAAVVPFVAMLTGLGSADDVPASTVVPVEIGHIWRLAAVFARVEMLAEATA